MLTVQEAQRLILKQAKLQSCVKVPLDKALGKVLREPIKADRDQPACSKSAMDGIAIAYAAWLSGCRWFKQEAIVPAGIEPKSLCNKKACVKIMTGACLPKGVDTVIPIEQVNLEGKVATVLASTKVVKGQYVRNKGADARKEHVLIPSGVKLEAPHIGVAASVGKNCLKVSKPVSMMVISTGDEIIPIDRQPKAYQVRQSNAYALKALLEATQLAKVDLCHLNDNKKTMQQRLKKIINSYQMVILSGGVSKGDYDYVPEVLKSLGVKEIFHRVNQKPGKPLWFGTKEKQCLIFGLPGNPVSTLICAYRYLVPLLNVQAGLRWEKTFIKLIGKLPLPKNGLIEFLPIKRVCLNGVEGGSLIPINNSGDFSALIKGDGFIEYGNQTTSLRPYFSWRV